MKVIALVVCFLFLAVALEARLTPRDKEIIDAVNAMDAGWTAGDNGISVLDGRRLAGTRLNQGPRLPQMPPRERGIPEGVSPPPSFDSRSEWPGCVGRVLDQGKCGSCWAFGTAETLSDRFCIHSNSSIHVQLAELDLVACDKLASGCNGGADGQAWEYAKNSGLVTDACYPYNKTIPTCPPAQEPCLTFVPTPACVPKCVNGDNWQQDKHFAASGYAVLPKVSAIEEEMVTNGPVQAGFTVYEDFLHYKSGVYRHIYGKEVGGHSVKIIGYGTQNGTEYWLVQNSWNTVWGEEGYFQILRGVDECGIESQINAGLPKLD